MRLFIALLFPDNFKNQIFDYGEEVRDVSMGGNFTDYNNLHLTVLYLGETNQDMYDQIKEKLSEIVIHPFSYHTGCIQCFRKDKSKQIVYLEVKENFELKRLYMQVTQKLKELGIDFPTKKYTPHITLGRQVSLIDVDDLEHIKTKSQTIPVNRISMMESTRVNGKLTYIERDAITLK